MLDPENVAGPEQRLAQKFVADLAENTLKRLAAVGVCMVGDRRITLELTPDCMPGLPRGFAWGSCSRAADSEDGCTNQIRVWAPGVPLFNFYYVLVHELLHALDDGASGHEGRWAQWAAQLGIKPTEVFVEGNRGLAGLLHWSTDLFRVPLAVVSGPDHRLRRFVMPPTVIRERRAPADVKTGTHLSRPPNP